METKRLVPAAQYVRMSTEDQQYSIANQESAIQTYAKSHGYVVTSTYADAGKSGVAIKHRKELRRLLHDVTSGQAPYKTILVYDVSRFGRFQDVDEAAYWLSSHDSIAARSSVATQNSCYSSGQRERLASLSRDLNLG